MTADCRSESEKLCKFFFILAILFLMIMMMMIKQHPTLYVHKQHARKTARTPECALFLKFKSNKCIINNTNYFTKFFADLNDIYNTGHKIYYQRIWTDMIPPLCSRQPAYITLGMNQGLYPNIKGY